MVAVIGELIELGGVAFKFKAVELVRKGYSRVCSGLNAEKKMETVNKDKKLVDVIREDGFMSVPPLLTDDERKRFEELTGAYLNDTLGHLVWLILENDLHEQALGPAVIPIRGAQFPGTEVRLVPWW